MKASAKARAARLVRLVERAIEAGAFTPLLGYLDSRHYASQAYIGPCGCALAAAAVVTGCRPTEGRHSAFAREPVARHLERRGLTKDEIDALEAGYEGRSWGCVPASTHRRLKVVTPAFYDAGCELRKFHPTVSR